MTQAMPGMKHAEPDMVCWQNDQRGEPDGPLADAGTVDFACTVAGRLEAVMAGKLNIR